MEMFMESVIEQDKERSKEYKYWELCGKVSSYMSKLFPNVSINITKFGFEIDLDIYYKGVSPWVSNNFNYSSKYLSASCSSYEDIYRKLIAFKTKEHFIREDMSLEEVELQLSIRGY